MFSLIIKILLTILDIGLFRVKEICEEAGIKLIKFYSYMSNKEDYIIKRIKKELESY